MKRLQVFLLLVLAVAAFGCNNVTDPVSIGPSVHGIVRDSSTGQPIEGVLIAVGGRSGVTAPNGSYFIAEVLTGNQTLTATKSGYATYSASFEIARDEVNRREFLMVKQ